jgi:GT2 family glycosyltransferase
LASRIDGDLVSAELSIIVVNWNGGELLKRCIDSVRQFPASIPFEVIVVDNASTDGTREWLTAQGDFVKLIANKENAGFAVANNRAFATSKTPLLFLLNSDAEIHPGTLDTLLATIRSASNIGVVGPRLVNTDGSLQPSVWRNPPTPFETLANAFRLYKLLPKEIRAKALLGHHWDHTERRSARLLSGAALMIKRKVIEEVGGFDERFHMYGEDTEWCLRVVKAGWTMLFEPDATVTHHGGASTAQRWTNLEKRRVEYLSFFQFQRLALSKRLAIGNLVTGLFTSSAQLWWRRLTRQPLDEPSMVARLYRKELQLMLTGNKSTEEDKDLIK